MVKRIWYFIERILRFIVYFFLGLLKKDISEDQWKSFIQFVKFGLVGVSNTLVSYFTYLIVIKLGAHYLVGNILGFVVSVLNSFYWNNSYVFVDSVTNNRRSVLATLIKTFIAYGFTGLILSNILLFVWVDICKIHEVIAPLINLLITIPLNFLINKLWAYR